MSIYDRDFEDRTVFDVTTNEGPLTLFLLGIECILLSIMYSIIALWFKVKYGRIRR